jgi:Xaa-Pro aminopeptidase
VKATAQLCLPLSSTNGSRFSAEEIERRVALARGLMADQNLDALLVFGNSGVNRHNNVNPFWLTQYLDMHHNYVIVPPDGGIELYVGLVNHVPNAREEADAARVEWAGYQPGETVGGRLRELGAKRVGLVGVAATWNVGMPYAHYLALSAHETVDVTREFAALRATKSAEEIERLRGAAELTDLAILAARDAAHPGVTELELVAEAEHAYRRRGGAVRITFLRSMPMDAPTGCLPAQNPSGRRLERGDVILTEFSASLGAYSGQVHRPIFVCADPTPEWQRLFDVAHEAYDRVAASLRPGANEGDAIRAAAVIGEAGYAIYDDLIHGYGTDYGPPLVDRSCVEYWRNGAEPPRGRAIERDAAVVVQPNPITPDERMGLQLGALTIVRDAGAECLHTIPFEPIVAG